MAIDWRVNLRSCHIASHARPEKLDMIINEEACALPGELNVDADITAAHLRRLSYALQLYYSPAANGPVAFHLPPVWCCPIHPLPRTPQLSPTPSAY
eukprot:77681-Pleurochrysis_carterae.AAC.1